MTSCRRLEEERSRKNPRLYTYVSQCSHFHNTCTHVYTNVNARKNIGKTLTIYLKKSMICWNYIKVMIEHCNFYLFFLNILISFYFPFLAPSLYLAQKQFHKIALGIDFFRSSYISSRYAHICPFAHISVSLTLEAHFEFAVTVKSTTKWINQVETITRACMIHESIMFVMSRHGKKVGVVLINYTCVADVFSGRNAAYESIIAW